MYSVILVIAVVWLVPNLLILTTGFACALLPPCRRWAGEYLFGSNSNAKPASSPDPVKSWDQASAPAARG